jgi:hypothetical protein
MSVKPVQPWVDYLLGEIEKDRDPALNSQGAEIRAMYQRLQSQQQTEWAARAQFAVIRKDVLETCAVKHHTEKLLDATLEYIIDPERKSKQ